MMDLSVPVAGCMRWGKWGANFTLADYRQIIDECLENGITSFDHADIYGDYSTEADFGEVIKERPSLRKDIQLITKCGIQLQTSPRQEYFIKSYNTSRDHIIASVEYSLRALCTDYIDVLLIHRPDPLMDPAEVAAAVAHLKQQGKILRFGVSNFSPHHTDLLRKFTEINYNQINISILNPFPFTNGVLDHCLMHGITPMAWAPLGGGIMNDDSHPRYRTIVATATELAEKYNTGVNQLLIAYLLKHPSGIVPVLGTTKIERLVQAREGKDVELSREDWFKLYVASTGEDVA
ncbi:MAG: aldo/keto reductase [Chitinophagaceae bacterium]|jgi:predicted oxidoreductase|nr:aldo/keto reductase [Chitinophagaceae bacterium]